MSAWSKSELLLVVGGAITTIFAVFPQAFADRLKSGLNLANQRSSQFKEIATIYSTFAYGAESIYETYYEGVTLKTINVRFARETVKGYNDAVTQMMNNQYVYQDEVRKLWGKKFFVFNTDLPERYDSLFRYAKTVDAAVHDMNWMGITLQPLKDDSNYTFKKWESDSLNKQLPVLQAKLAHLRHLTEQMIDALE